MKFDENDDQVYRTQHSVVVTANFIYSQYTISLDIQAESALPICLFSLSI